MLTADQCRDYEVFTRPQRHSVFVSLHLEKRSLAGLYALCEYIRISRFHLPINTLSAKQTDERWENVRLHEWDLLAVWTHDYTLDAIHNAIMGYPIHERRPFAEQAIRKLNERHRAEFGR